MKSINSVSGGKTSAYMAVHFPADYNIFSLVCINDKNCTPDDSSIVKYASDKLGGEFIATAESDTTLYAMRELEQILGKSIVWVRGQSFDDVIVKRKALPNMMMRFCTSELKMKPIFDYCHTQIKSIVEMRIGFRYDEKERANADNVNFKTIVGVNKNGTNKWDEIEWRTLSYPLIDSKKTHYEVYQWSQNSGITFPDDSNCVGCFWKPIQQLRKNWDNEPKKMQWFADKEKQTNRRFKKDMSYSNIKKIGLQSDFFFGTGSGCQAGYCTD